MKILEELDLTHEEMIVINEHLKPVQKALKHIRAWQRRNFKHKLVETSNEA